jgi:phage baseplate assembly protein W
MCQQPASEINEIVMRSRSKKAVMDWKNRVTLCREDHRKYHDGGVTDAKIVEMRLKRSEFLVMIGRDEYV